MRLKLSSDCGTRGQCSLHPYPFGPGRQGKKRSLLLRRRSRGSDLRVLWRPRVGVKDQFAAHGEEWCRPWRTEIMIGRSGVEPRTLDYEADVLTTELCAICLLLRSHALKLPSDCGTRGQCSLHLYPFGPGGQGNKRIPRWLVTPLLARPKQTGKKDKHRRHPGGPKSW